MFHHGGKGVQHHVCEFEGVLTTESYMMRHEAAEEVHDLIALPHTKIPEATSL